MHIFSTLQHKPTQVDELLQQLEENFASSAGGPQLCAVFTSQVPFELITQFIGRVRDRWNGCCVFGCDAESVLGNDEECEGQAAISLWAAELPDVEVIAFHLEYESTAEGGAFVGWPELSETDWTATRGLIAIGEPFSFPMDGLLERMNEDHPGLPIIGGMASAGQTPGSNRLWLNDESYQQGAVLVRLAGNLRVSSIVSQGCRPIGEPMVVTKAERNAITELGGRPAIKVLHDLYQTLPTSEQRLVQYGLQLGRVMSEYGDRKTMGDFLVRSIVGIEPDLQAIVVGDFFRPGQTVQFHLRDELSATVEFQQLLKQSADIDAAGALLFTCNGRGTRLFSEPNHDVSAMREQFAELPIAGFFAAGEIGPVGRDNYFHGFTAAAMLIGPAEE